ncbi:hypothetical protein [Stygiolobus caldivivus]|uniref:Uncharacterized protein n=1 Tax=Stygiolobus caldivivus TaxID=2824673 RepID=A0A8D5U8A0_9CREN|nr:hypothetical protein [Stygiolobus caldivivus]BCU71441.1 hypothetical protein KN1_27380 [Stygiolobus caldivivus]
MSSVNIKEILKEKRTWLNGVKSPNPEERAKAWEMIRLIVDTGNGNELRSYLGYLRSLLWHSLQGVRDDAWENIDLYKKLLVKGVERGLMANSDRIKWSAWSKVIDMVNMGIISKDQVIQYRHSYWRLLRSRWVTIRKKSWRLFVDLVEYGIFQNKDKERFKEFLRHKKASVRIYAWEATIRLMRLGFISKDEVMSEIKYLTELTAYESNIKKRAEKVLKGLKS